MQYDAAGGTEAAQPLYGTKMVEPKTDITNERPVDRARLAIEHRLGRRLSEQEWASYRLRLVAFFQLLRSWEKRSLP
jgi:hypothetical protein